MRNEREHDHSKRTDQARQSGSVLAALFVGGLVGAGAMMLFAPRSGKVTRSSIQHKTLEVRDKAVGKVKGAMEQVSSRTRELTGDAKDKAGEMERQGREILAQQLDKVAAAAKAGKDAVER